MAGGNIQGSISPKKTKGYGYVILIIVLAIAFKYFGGLMGKNRANEVNIRELNNKIAIVQVIKTSQPSSGKIESDLDQTVLTNFEEWFLDTAKKKYEANLIKQGITANDNDLNFKTNSHYVEKDNKKLGVINIMHDRMRYIIVIGIKEDELITIRCIRNSNHDFSAFTGVCGEEVTKTFNINFETSTE